MIIVFDLDDTLYDEITFVKSGFKAVSGFLNKEFKTPMKESYNFMLSELNENGRGHIFDSTLKKFASLSKRNIKLCVSAYRLHNPKIKLNKDAVSCLKRFKSSSKYIVTDGNKVVQSNKVKALKVENKVKKVFITHRYGLKHSKPSPYCFQKIIQLEKAKPSDLVYIGDNPFKDFVGIKPLGVKTIRILKGDYKNSKVAKKFNAHITINSLDEINHKLLLKLK